MTVVPHSSDVALPNAMQASRQGDSGTNFNAFDALQSQTAVLGHDGTILFVNEAWRQFGLQNGYAGADLGVGRD
jgi:hypothetical protein